MRSFLTLARVEVSLLLREPAALFFMLALPMLLLALNGSEGNAPRPELGGAGLVDVMVPGYVLLVMLTSGLMALPETLASYRERGFLRRMRASPLRPWQILGAHAATQGAVALIGLVLLVGVGIVAFDLRRPAGWAAALAAIAASAAAVIAVGFLLASVLPTARTTQAVAAAIYFPAIFISGAVVPTEGLPQFAQHLGQALPFTYAVRALREAWTAGTLDGVAFAALAATVAVAVPIAVRTFRWESRY